MLFKKTITLLLLGLTLMLSASFSTETSVFLCDSQTAHKYHFYSDCRGLNACTHTIIKVPLSEAKKQGRTICGWED